MDEEVKEFDANDSSFSKRLADGHLLRKGHTLEAHWKFEEGYFKVLVRTCCKD